MCSHSVLSISGDFTKAQSTWSFSVLPKHFIATECIFSEDKLAAMNMQSVTRPLAFKLTISSFVYALIISIFFGFILYLESKEAVIEQEVQKLVLEADIIKPLVSDFYDQSAKDITFLAASQSAKSLSQESVDNQSSQRLNELALANLMYELLKNHKYYKKISLLKINQTANVQVSVIRKQGDLIVLDKEQLQKNVTLDALAPLLMTNANKSVYFSKIEFEQINENALEQATFFAALPLHNNQARLTAIIALEVNLFAYLSEIKSSILKNINFYMLAPSGEIVFPHIESNELSNQLNVDTMKEQVLFQNKPKVIKEYSRQFPSAHIAYYTPVEFLSFPEQPKLHLFIENQSEQFSRAIQAMQLRTAAISLLIALFSILMFVFLANKLVKPIKQIIQSIESIDNFENLSKLPIELNDEIGVLARRFKALYENLSFSYQKEREAKITATNISMMFESILDSMADAVVTIDNKGIIQAFNKSAIRIFGYDEDEVIGRHIKLIMPVTNINKDVFSLDKTLDEVILRLIGAPQELTAVRKDGEWFPILLNISKVNIDQQVFYTGLIRDITQLKAIEEEKKRVLQDAKNAAWRLNFALSAPNIGVWDVELNTNEIKCDERIYKLFCIEPKSGLSARKQWRKMVHPEDLPRIEKEFYRLVKYGREGQFQHRIIIPTGEIKHVEAHAQIMFSETGVKSRIVGTYRDITEQVQIYELKQHALDMAEASLKLKSDFLASMSHEIRTPMNGVIGMLGLLEQSELTKQQQHYVFLASSSANSLLSLINDILDFSKIEAGKLDLEIVEFDLINQLNEFAESIALKAQEKGVELVLDVTNLNHEMVLGDPGRLRQILTNLVGNAIKFTENGEIVIKANVAQKNDRVKFTCSVSDTGIGIPRDKLATLFDSFTQVDASTTRKYGGTGLGLAIVKQLSELMHGGLKVTSEEGKGSTFTFDLVFEQCNSKSQSIPKIDITDSNILIVDDNDTNLAVLSCQLKMWGANVFTACHADEATNLLAQKQAGFFDAAILDMQMPEKDGAMLGREIKANKDTQYLPLILMTSISFQGESKYFENLGFAAYFSKPATTSDLFDTLSLVLDAEGGSPATSIITHSKLLGLQHNEVVFQMPNIARIMVVEDNRINQVVLLGILQNIGLKADVAGNGKEAIELLLTCSKDAQYQLIIMDCQMPELDGYQATEAIRAGKAGERFVDIPIIAMTANAMKGDEDKCLKAGMSDYATKPINADILQEKLCFWLGEREPNDKIEIKIEDSSSTLDKPLPKKNTVAGEKLLDWDKATFYQRISNNESLANRLVELYLNDMPDLIEQLEQAIKVSNNKLVTDLAHRIKGSSRNLAANIVADHAEDIESRALTQSEDELLINLKHLKKAFESLKKELVKNSVY